MPDRVRHRLYAALGTTAVVAGIVGAVVVFDPLGSVVGALPLPDLPNLPDLPDWTRWLRLGVVIGLIVLGIVAALDRSSGSDEDDAGGATDADLDRKS
jgi:hypothetical protein